MRIKKTSQTTPVQAEVVNTYSESQENAYSCDYINDRNTYSTSEVNTGKTWIDGKAIYRKVIKITSGISTGTTITTNISDFNIDKCINIKGFTYSSTFGYVPINFYNGSNYNYVHTGGGNGFNNIYWRIDIGASEVYFILEYTKTN